jgi:hypothetical protein
MAPVPRLSGADVEIQEGGVTPNDISSYKYVVELFFLDFYSPRNHLP